MIFEKNKHVKIEDKEYEVILADEEYAALAPVRRVKKDNSIRRNFSKVCIWDNHDEFIELIRGLEFLD
jgi:hypothetical protein